jgi:hypothetical protein
VNIVLGAASIEECPRLDLNGTGTVGIANLIGAVASASQPALRDAQESLLYTNFIYNDPLVLPFVPPKQMGGAHALDEERSITYCALYDNGFDDPATVKKQSTSPPPPLGGPCQAPSGCTAGRVTQTCSGRTTRNATPLATPHPRQALRCGRADRRSDHRG